MSNACVGSMPTKVDLCVYQGDTAAFDVIVVEADGSPSDFTDCTASAQIRATPLSDLVLATFDTEIDGNVIHLLLSADQTRRLAGAPIWDLQIDDQGIVATLAYGGVKVTRDVTR